MLCSHCSFKNPPDANYCSSCGTALARPSEDATITFPIIDVGEAQLDDELLAAIKDLPPGEALLYVKRGTNVGATYLLDTDIVRVGRHPDNEVFLDDVTVSRRHAEFRREQSHFLLQDVGSLNGTYRNGERVELTELRLGDEIQIGKFKLIFLTNNAEQ